MKILATFVFVLLAITAFSQQQPETLKQNITFQLDEHGNGDLEVIMKLNASQWDVFKKTTGTSDVKQERDSFGNAVFTFKNIPIISINHEREKTPVNRRE